MLGAGRRASSTARECAITAATARSRRDGRAGCSRGLSVQNREWIITNSHHGKGGSYEEEALRCRGCPIGGFASWVRRNVVGGWRTAARAVQEDQRKLQRQE